MAHRAVSDAGAIITALDLAPHPEGGWYRELWRGPTTGDAGDNGRAVATSIHFLLEAGQKSHWHKVDAAEIWLWHAGDPLDLWLADGDDGPMRCVTLGPDLMTGAQHLQHTVAAGEWQGAMPGEAGTAGYSLVSCVVAPGFTFAGFTLAAPDWAPGCGRPAT